MQRLASGPYPLRDAPSAPRIEAVKAIILALQAAGINLDRAVEMPSPRPTLV